jgi:PAS domain S-box-containing protein
MQVIEEKLYSKKQILINIQLLKALDSCNEMVLLTDSKGIISYANQSVYKYTGWSKATLLEKNVTVLDSPNVNKNTLKELKKCLRRNKPWSGRLLARRKGMEQINILGQTTAPDPLEYWVEVNITPILENGKKSGYVEILRDISHLIKKEDILEIEREDITARFAIANILQQTIPLKQRFIEVMSILFALKSCDIGSKGGVFLKAEDENFLDMFALKGEFSDEFIRKEQRIALGACLCGRAAVSGKMIISDDCFCDPDHEHQFKGMKAHGHYIVPIVFNNDILGVLFLYTSPYPARNEERINIFTQVGEMMALALLKEKAQVSLTLAHETALQAAKDKSEFLANMSHEIRTPMNGVLGMLGILKDTEMTDEQRDMVETAANSANSLLIILNDILNFSKLEAGKVELENSEFDLPNLVEDVCSLMALGKGDKKLDINCFLATKLQSYWLGDEVRIRQILTNLLGNAIKFTNTGEVTVNVRIVKNAKQESEIRFEIQDTGIGISPEIQKYLFQPFSQADSSTARHFGGTGLGLSICKDLVELMGGDIGVESELGEGALFWFTLPLQLSGRQVKDLSKELFGQRALIVDENMTSRIILENYLQSWGCDVDQVDNTSSALDKLDASLEQKKYDLLLLGSQLATMTGLEFTKEIHKKLLYKQIPCIILFKEITDSDKYQEFSSIQSLSKPICKRQLFEAILKALHIENHFLSTAVMAPDEINLPDYGDYQILVAEDNKINQKVIFSFLNQFNSKVDLVENGQLVLDKLATKKYDLVFMDCQMPIMDGYEATRKLRENNLTKKDGSRLPIIALTANANEGDKEKCLDAGMDDYLAKPIERELLTGVLSEWLDSSD